MIHSIFDSILLYPRFNSKYYSIQKKSADSIQKIIQFNSQGIIDTGRIGKVPNDCPRSVQIRQKGGFSSKMANIDQSRCQLLEIKERSCFFVKQKTIPPSSDPLDDFLRVLIRVRDLTTYCKIIKANL